jgi:PKD repeat protein
MVASGIVGTDSYTRHNYITVNPPVPSGTFSGTPLIGRAPHVVNFTNTIADASTFSWNFGDLGTSTSRNPTYVYHTPGTYTVGVTATGSGGTYSTSRPTYVCVWDVNERLIYSPDTPPLNWVTTSSVTHNYVSLVDFQESDPGAAKQLYIIGDGNPGANSISSIRNLNYYTSLTDLKIQNHPQLTSLDVTINGSLIKNLYCDGNFLNSLVGLSEHTNLEAFHCENNRLTSLGVSNEKLDFCTRLTSLICNNNSLTKLDLSSNISLQTLYCQGNQITTLTFPNTNTTTLTTVYCYSNKLTDLDVENLTELVTLGMGHNSSMGSPVNIDANIKLKEFTFGNNFWTTCPDLTKNTLLTKIDCSFNSFQEMNVSESVNLESLYCNNGLLTKLTGLTDGDSTTIDKVTILIAHSNRFTSTTIDNILILLNNKGKSNGTVRLDGPGNEKRTSNSDAAVTALLGKGWSVRVNT